MVVKLKLVQQRGYFLRLGGDYQYWSMHRIKLTGHVQPSQSEIHGEGPTVAKPNNVRAN